MTEATRVASPTYSSRSLAGSKEGNLQTTSPRSPVRLNLGPAPDGASSRQFHASICDSGPPMPRIARRARAALGLVMEGRAELFGVGYVLG
jgi:hypothetical protein